MPIDIAACLLYEQGPCLIFNKPSGILTQAAPGVDSFEEQVRAWTKIREQKQGNIYLTAVHRLDRPVSGVIVFARHVRAARRLAEQFEARVVRKTYWALVEGRVAPSLGTWSDFVRKIPDMPQAEIVSEDHPEGREATLHYRALGEFPSTDGQARTLLEIELETGRMHQIRIQAASRGWPVLGDAQYGSQGPFGELFEDPRERAIALHARSLALRHPMTHEPIEVTAPLPAAWRALGFA